MAAIPRLYNLLLLGSLQMYITEFIAHAGVGTCFGSKNSEILKTVFYNPQYCGVKKLEGIKTDTMV